MSARPLTTSRLGPLVCFAALALPLPARAADVAVRARGCPSIASPVGAALGLELSAGWRVAPAAPLALLIEVATCEDARWTLRMIGARGEVLRGPEVIDMASFGPRSRARVAALWAAERLPTDGPTARDAAPGSAPEPVAAETLGSPEPPTEPAPVDTPPLARPAHPPRPLGPLRVFASVGGAGLVDPAELASFALTGRAGAGAQLGDWILLAGAVEADLLWEPFGHLNPAVRLCAEPRLTIPFDGGLELFVGPSGCLSVSRHIRGIQDEWTGGASAGGLVGFSVSVLRRLWLGLRLDGAAWARDPFAPVSRATFAGAVRTDMPWVGIFRASLEVRWAPD